MAYRLCLRSGILLAALAGAAGTASLCIAGPLASGDRSGAKSQNDPRNFDWTRPLPDEIAPNPTQAPGPRPYLRDVGTQNPDDRATVEPSARSMWARPKPEELSPNPTAPWGMRPYLRSVGPGIAQNQGNVKNYSGAAYSGPKQQPPTRVAGGGTRPGGNDRSDASKAQDSKQANLASPAKDSKAQSEPGARHDQKQSTDQSGAKANTKTPDASGPEGEKNTTAGRAGAQRKEAKEQSLDPTQPAGAKAAPNAGTAAAPGSAKAENKQSDAAVDAKSGKPTANDRPAEKKAEQRDAKDGTPGSPQGSAQAAGKKGGDKIAAQSPMAPPPTAPGGEDRPGGGGTMADISAIIREYLAAGAQSGNIDLSEGLSKAIGSLFTTGDLASLTPSRLADPPSKQAKSDAPAGSASALPVADPDRSSDHAAEGQYRVIVGRIPGRLEFSGLPAGVRGDFRPSIP